MVALRSASSVRLSVMRLLVLSLLVTLVARLAYVQLIVDRDAEAAPTQSRLRTVALPALRGMVLDSAGLPLAANRGSLVVAVDPLTLADQPDGGAAVVERLAAVLDLGSDEVRARMTACGADGAAPPPRCYAGPPVEPAPVAVDVDPSTVLRIVEHPDDFPGVHAGSQPVRTYPAPGRANAAHLLGYLAPVTADELAGRDDAGDPPVAGADLVGRAGLEQAYDADLRGVVGERTVSVDSRGRVLGLVSERDPIAGDHLVTHIDAGLQAVTEAALQDAVSRARTQIDPGGRHYVADAGAAVVMDVTDGSVLALASYPTYDPSLWVGGISTPDYAGLVAPDAGEPLLSRSVQAELAPASTFKVVSAGAALEAGYGTGPYDCTSELAVGDRTFRNYESRAYGSITLGRALEVSCDTVFYRLGYDMWLAAGGSGAPADAADPISAMATGWGLGRPTGVDLPGEAAGRVADRAWKQAYWERTRAQSCARARDGYPELATTDPARAAYLTELARESCEDGWRVRAGDAVNAAIGQGDMLVTPLQVATAYAAIANGGTLWRPRVAAAVVDSRGELVRSVEPVASGALPVSAVTLDYVRAALRAVPRTGTGAAAFAGFPLDQVPIGAKTGSGEVFGAQSTSWFAAFSDRYVVVVVVEQGGTGGATSGPAARTILDALYGVRDGVAHFDQAVFPAGAPPTELPAVSGAAVPEQADEPSPVTAP